MVLEGIAAGSQNGSIEPTRRLIAEVFRQDAGQAIATLIGQTGSFDLAEDALQDALVTALERWPVEGVPPRPAAWLMTTARRKAIDRLRRNATLANKQEQLTVLVRLEQQEREAASAPEDWMDAMRDEIPDDRLKLLFTCCHPALEMEARVALTLHTLGGLTTPEIAAAFLVPTPTMAQRLTRAKRKIREARIPYRTPPLDLLPERLPALLAVLYLIFNAGYTAPTGAQLQRRDLCDEAIRLARILVGVSAREELDRAAQAEAQGVLALMLLHHSRRDARLRSDGALLLLGEQDRATWNQHNIREGSALVEQALRLRRPGPYQVQAAIAAVHAQAMRAEETDWSQIAALYGVLASMTCSPVVELNRAVAVAMADGSLAGLAMLHSASLAEPLANYHLYHAARADLLRRSGQHGEALQAYQQALDLCQNAVERAFLTHRIAELSAVGGDGV
ncbi:MAG: RNA polymerase sigma factor [Ktedonobacterales bacterium]